MRRREFITLFGGAAVWPLAARAQRPSTPLVGYLTAIPLTADAIGAFRAGLSETGFVEGRNVAIEFRSANYNDQLLPELAADLVRRGASLIYASGGAIAVRAAQAATSIIPIVFAMGADPVTSGLVTSLSRPSGNITGISFLSNELGPKRLGLLNELVPGASRYALLVNPRAPTTESLIIQLRAAAAQIGKDVEVFNASSIGEIDVAFAKLVRSGADALVVGSSSLLSTRGVQLATLATFHHLPAIYYDRRIVEVGGLMSYGANIADAVRQAGIYAGRILKGERPGDLPVVQATTFEFVINLETAKTLGLTIPPSLRALADEVIE
jgi:putative ABC transport system substrate-binding protein